MSVESHWMPAAFPFFKRWKVEMISCGVIVMLLFPACCERVLCVGIFGSYGSFGGCRSFKIWTFSSLLRAHRRRQHDGHRIGGGGRD